MRRVLLLLMLAGLLALATAGPAFAQPLATTAPTVTVVAPNYAGVAVTTNVTVTFSEPVNGVDGTTFGLYYQGVDTVGFVDSTVTVAADRLSATLDPNADLATATFYLVEVTTGVTGDAGNPMWADFISSFTTMEEPGTAPLQVMIYRVDQRDPTNASTINFGVYFTEPVSDFVTGDVTLSGTAGAATATVTAVDSAPDGISPGALYNVAVSSMTQDGTVTVDVPAGVATADATGYLNLASTNQGNTIVFDTTPPTIISVTPPDGATGVAVATNVTVTFSEPVNGAKALGFINMPYFIPATITLAADRRSVTLDPGMDLADATLHTVFLANGDTGAVGVTDDAGNPLAAEFISSFTTVAPDVAPLTVTIHQVSNDPTNGSPVNFIASFSELVSDFVTGDVTLSGTAGATTATVTPISLTQDATTPAPTYLIAVSGMTWDGTVTVNIDAGVASSDATGALNLASTSPDNTVIFDTTAPTVTSVTPVDLATNVSVGTVVRATFSEAMKEATINTSTFTLFTLEAPGPVAVVGAVVSYDTATETATFALDRLLDYDTTYMATVTNGAQDLAENGLADNYTWSFTTAAPPDTTPPDGHRRDPSGERHWCSREHRRGSHLFRAG